MFFLPNNDYGYGAAEFAGKRHFINFEILEWRAKIFGMQLFNFEIGVNSNTLTNSGVNLTTLMRGEANIDLDANNVPTITSYSDMVQADGKTMWFAYKPAIKFYVPCTAWMAVELYGGVEVDMTYAFSKLASEYYAVEPKLKRPTIPMKNFFFGAYGGAGLMFSAVPAIPLEIKAEYRHSFYDGHWGNPYIVPAGMYVSVQVHLGAPIRKNKDKKKK